MTKPLFSKGMRKHIRFQKARIRREFSDLGQQQELISKLYEGFAKKTEKKPVQINKGTQKKREELALGKKEK